MNIRLKLKASLMLAAMLSLPIAQAQTMPMYDAAYKAAKSRISANYKAAMATCAKLAGNAQGICIEAARAKETAARAELKSGYPALRCETAAGDAKATCIATAAARFGKT